MTTYELWLDESGDFKNEKEKRYLNQKASLIGGILMPEDRSDDIPFATLLDEQRNHAMELTDQDKREYVLPALEKLIELNGVREVFFENAGYQDSSTHRQLYLKIMAEGLLQLMLRLNAIEEAVCLQILIARRQDTDANPEHKVIQEKEYLRELERCIERKKREHRLVLHEDSRMSFEIKPASESRKLQLADFACNTRLTRDSKTFQGVRERVEKLYENSYIFSTMEVNSENYILMCLSQGLLSDAFVELYTTRDKINRERSLDVIFQKIRNWSYRLVKDQLQQTVADLRALMVLEDDYELGEELLKNINKEVVPRLLEMGGVFRDFHFFVLLSLADMYLSEGDILSARDTLADCEAAQKQMGDSLENVLNFYQYQEKLALYKIASFQYLDASGIMERAAETFHGILSTIKEDKHLTRRFSECRSEHLGNAICMQLYSLMFLQRKNPNSYPTLCALYDKAIMQYPDHEGELEKIRQYRSHIEMEQGNYEPALQYLIMAKLYRMPELAEQNILYFLNLVAETEPEVSCIHYLMYYIEIMCEAKKAGSVLADHMAAALEQQPQMCRMLELENIDYGLENQVKLTDIQKQSTGILYHPMEIIYWKYGVYIYHCHIKRGLRIVRRYLEKAIQICRAYQEYLTMQVCSLGIEAELIGICKKNGIQQEAKDHLEKLLNTIEAILLQDLDSGTKEILRQIEEKIKKEDYQGAADLIVY